MITDLRKQRPITSSPSLRATLALGFRPFFLGAAMLAATLLPLWLCVFTGMVRLPTAVAPAAWHAHEMVFGFVGAVLAGFLLTAAKNWTSRPTLEGPALGALALLWIVGRVLMASSGSQLRLIASAVDLAFVPTFAAALAVPIVRARSWRNLGFVVLLGALTVANVLFHFGEEAGQLRATRVAIDIILLIIILMGGRVIPSFTENALGRSTRTSRALSWACFVAMLLVTALDALDAPRAIAGVSAIAAGVLNGLRMFGWRSVETRGRPILWVLHVGYAWLALGLALKGIAAFIPSWPASAPLHALTIGAVGMLILGMMSRVSLGHTGRLLEVHPAMSVAFGLLASSAVVRSLGPLVWPEAYMAELWLSGVLWTAAFALFVIVYLPVLTAPRVDGRPG